MADEGKIWKSGKRPTKKNEPKKKLTTMIISISLILLYDSDAMPPNQDLDIAFAEETNGFV